MEPEGQDGFLSSVRSMAGYTGASFSFPQTPAQQLGQALAGGAEAGDGLSASFTQLGDAVSTGVGEINGLSINLGALIGNSTVSDVKWENCECQ